MNPVMVVEDSLKKRSIKYLEYRTVFLSLSSNSIGPIVPYLLITSGGGANESALFQAFNNLASNMGQIFWGRVADATGMLRELLALGASSVFISSALYSALMFLGLLNPTTIIAVSAVTSLLASASGPVVAAVVAAVAPPTERNRIYALISNCSVASMMASNIISLAILVFHPGTQGILAVMIISAALAAVSIAASLAIPRVHTASAGNPVSIVDLAKGFLEPLKGRPFRVFLAVNTYYNLALSTAWPLFSLFQVRVLKMGSWEVVLLSLVSNASNIVGQHLAGKYAKRGTYRRLALLNRLGLVAVPLVYSVATSPIHLYAMNIFAGVLVGLGNIVFTAYILEIAPQESRATYLGLYNTAVGLATFAGSLIGGAVAGFLTGLYGDEMGLRISFLICVALRLSAALVAYRSKKFAAA